MSKWSKGECVSNGPTTASIITKNIFESFTPVKVNPLITFKDKLKLLTNFDAILTLFLGVMNNVLPLNL